MFRLCLASLVIIVLHSLEPSHEIFSMIPVVKKVTSNANAKYVNVTTVIVQNGPVTNQTLSIIIEIRRELKECKLTASFYPMIGNRTAPNALVSRYVDMCRFLANPNDRLLKLIYDTLRQSSAVCLPSKCPMQRGSYFIRDFFPNTMQVPGFLPVGDFVAVFFFDKGPGRELLAEWRYFGRMTRVTGGETVEIG